MCKNIIFLKFIHIINLKFKLINKLIYNAMKEKNSPRWKTIKKRGERGYNFVYY